MRSIIIGLIVLAGVAWGQDSLNVTRVGTWDDEYAKAVALGGPFAYVVPGGAVSVIDISNPCSPQTIAYVPAYSAEDLALEGNYLYVASGFDGLRIFDVHDPYAPVQVAIYDLHRVYDVVVRDQIAYVAASNDGLYVLDVSNPLAPSQIG